MILFQIKEMEKDVKQQEKSAIQAATIYDNCKLFRRSLF
jgi:hypothetical protein